MVYGYILIYITLKIGETKKPLQVRMKNQGWQHQTEYSEEFAEYGVNTTKQTEHN